MRSNRTTTTREMHMRDSHHRVKVDDFRRRATIPKNKHMTNNINSSSDRHSGDRTLEAGHRDVGMGFRRTLNNSVED